MGVGLSLTLLPAFGTLFLLVDSLIQPSYEGRYLVFLQFDVTCLISLGKLHSSEGKLGKKGEGGG